MDTEVELMLHFPAHHHPHFKGKMHHLGHRQQPLHHPPPRHPHHHHHFVEHHRPPPPPAPHGSAPHVVEHRPPPPPLPPHRAAHPNGNLQLKFLQGLRFPPPLYGHHPLPAEGSFSSAHQHPLGFHLHEAGMIRDDYPVGERGASHFSRHPRHSHHPHPQYKSSPFMRSEAVTVPPPAANYTIDAGGVAVPPIWECNPPPVTVSYYD